MRCRPSGAVRRSVPLGVRHRPPEGNRLSVTRGVRRPRPEVHRPAADPGIRHSRATRPPLPQTSGIPRPGETRHPPPPRRQASAVPERSGTRSPEASGVRRPPSTSAGRRPKRSDVCLSTGCGQTDARRRCGAARPEHGSSVPPFGSGGPRQVPRPREARAGSRPTLAEDPRRGALAVPSRRIADDQRDQPVTARQHRFGERYEVRTVCPFRRLGAQEHTRRTGSRAAPRRRPAVPPCLPESAATLTAHRARTARTAQTAS